MDFVDEEDIAIANACQKASMMPGLSGLVLSLF
jgi:hypothetical protein